ncbi:hypothetical protein [Leifsonia sp. NCR5]|uniref:hypothetical protein n=1 Tax=Leifsonia sp. NCR5 TaxID=1978342 RepID=UPI00117BC412|nr:hypothetical protein [Leifsonia sp. NCR5]
MDSFIEDLPGVVRGLRHLRRTALLWDVGTVRSPCDAPGNLRLRLDERAEADRRARRIHLLQFRDDRCNIAA